MVAAVSMVKDEADIIDAFVRKMAAQVDFLIVADNGSTDGTREMLEALAEEFVLTVVGDPEVGYFQSFKMTRLARKAYDLGAEYVIPADADEVWYSPHGRIKDILPQHEGASCFPAALYDHVPTGIDSAEGSHVERIGWRRLEPTPLPKVAVRPMLPVTVEQGNHGASWPLARVEDVLVVRHFPIRSPGQMVRKARNGGAAYAATDLPEHVGAHWRQWNKLKDHQLGDVFREHYWSPDPQSDPSLIFDPCP